MSRGSFAALDLRARSDWERCEFVTVTEVLLRRAEEVVLAHGIKTLDAIHIGSALVFQESYGSDSPS
jgi:hypothetical protein